MSIGPHTGGELWTADQGALSCREKWCLFNGNAEHATLPFSGTRISFIAFTHGLYNKLDPYVAKQLSDLSFTAGRCDGVDLPFFEAFRIEKSYLKEEQNETFRAFVATRLEEAAPPPNAAGTVAVECYGRQVRETNRRGLS